MKRVENKRRPYSVGWIDWLEGDLEKENDMALSGYVTAEQRRCRQVMTTKGLVVAYWYAPQDYEIFRNGVSLGRVKKFNHWYPEVQTPHATLGDGSRWPQKTRQAAIEWVVKHYKRQPSNA